MTDASHPTVLGSDRSPLRGALLAAALVVAAWVLWRHSPESPLLPIACPSHALTGLHCPGCGTMRGLHAILHGRILAGIASNPFAAVVVPWIGAEVLSDIRRSFTGRGFAVPRIPQPALRLLPWLLIAYTVARNLPWAPFTALAP